MIPVKEKIEEVSNLPGEPVYATIGDPRMVMKSLTKLYSNTALATIREYSTNARDSNVEAGRGDVPVEVTLPSVLNPYFIVKDTGIGLSESELKEIYVSYGTSTKRDSNEFNGMLGFGSKSALAYTNQFTVTAVKDGKQTIAVITRKPDYSVALQVVATSKTTERNGVTIKVPVQEAESFRRIAMDFYRFWQPGTILVDGVEPVQAVGEQIDDNLYYSKNQGTSYVVMGNVGYRVANPEALFQNKRMNAISFVAYVENGSVEFTPSREDLEYSAATKATLAGIIEKFEKKMQKAARDEISKAGDSFEAYSKWVEWGNRLGYAMFEDLKYDGDKFEKNIPFKLVGKVYNPNTYRRYNTDDLRPQWDELTVAVINNNGFLITDMSAADLNSVHKAKAKEYLGMNGISASKIYFLWESVDNKWIIPERKIAWKDLLAALPKKPKAAGGGPSGRIPGSFDYIDEDGRTHTGKTLPDDATIFWISVQGSKRVNLYNLALHHKAVQTKPFKKSVAIVILSENRIAKFCRENPKVKNFKEWADKFLITDGSSLLSDEAKAIIAISNNSNWTNVLTKFPSDKILDPDWKKYSELLAKKQELMLGYNRALSYAIALGRRWEFKTYEADMRVNLPFHERYPLLAHHMGWNFNYGLKDEWIAYMNDAYRRKVKASV